MGPGQKLVKWLMLIFNLGFWISGIGLIIAGAVGQTAYKPYMSFLNDSYVSAPVLLIIVGAIISIIAFFGCCGSAKENYCMLMVFAVLLGIIFVVELAGGISGYVERNKLESYLQDKMQASLRRYNASFPGSPANGVWDNMQVDMQCCGVDGYIDWSKNATMFPPASCCKNFPTNCDRNATTLDNAHCSTGNVSCPIYTVGCLNYVSSKLGGNIATLGGVGIGVAFIQLIGITLACFLARGIRRGYTYPS